MEVPWEVVPSSHRPLIVPSQASLVGNNKFSALVDGAPEHIEAIPPIVKSDVQKEPPFIQNFTVEETNDDLEK
jgi:hypothetical protein